MDEATITVRQLELEEDMRGYGVKRYLKRLDKAEEVELPPGVIMLRQTVGPFLETLQTWAKELHEGNPRRFGEILRYLEEVGLEQVAFITARFAVNCISTRTKATAAALHLAGDLEEELEYRDFRRSDPKAFKRIMDKVAVSSQGSYRRKVVQLMRRRQGIPDRDWKKELKLKMGMKLLEMMADSTGLICIDTNYEGGAKTTHYIQGTDKAREWLQKQHGKCQLLSPVMLPMVCPPVEWEGPRNGGYLTFRLPLIKTPNRHYLDEIEHMDLPMVYQAVNALQATRWRINRKVYDVLRDLWELGGDRAGLPERDPRPLPNKPLDIDTNEAALKAWKRAAYEVYSHNNRSVTKIASVSQKLWVAEKFLDEEAIYFVWTLDWRGRAYPCGNFVHPQSDDSGKALLEFADGKPLGEVGRRWLAIHLANTWGNDKVPYLERVAWAEEHTAEILAYAADPLVNKGWMDADSPFCFLAACFEWLGYKRQGESYVCHLPIQVDGSCNGLQNFSAMLLDEIGGRATNLIPSERPQDIYGLVAAEVENLLVDECAQGVPEAEVFRGKVTRKLTKRNTMTMPYSVTQFGMKDQLIEEFRKLEEAGHPFDFQGLNAFSCASYLAGLNYTAIGRVVVAAKNAMDWLKAVAKIAASDGLPVIWTNPAGLPIQQAYMETSGKRVRVVLDGKEVNFFLRVEGKSLDGRKQAAGIAPNFVHSCDSGHMMRTLGKCIQEGIYSFSFIHDSYGTHACDMDRLSALLREAFVEQYSEGILEKFREELVEQLTRSGADALVEKIPPLPPKGKLDLEAVKDSVYFFA